MADDDRLTRAAQVVWQHARVLEQRRFRHHFEVPDQAGVLAALAAYETDDGGYGFALEADGRGPVSQPLHVDFALKVLDDIGTVPGDIAERVCGYLASLTRPDGGLPAVHESIRDYPKAPWWFVDDGTAGSLIPTASIAGILLANGIDHPWVAGAVDFCWGAVEAIADHGDTHPYGIVNASAFLDNVPEADHERAAAAAAKLGELVRDKHWVLLDASRPDNFTLPTGYAPGEFVLPYDYAPKPTALARKWFSDKEFDLALTTLAEEGETDGGWQVRWKIWSPVVESEWRGYATVQALLTLRTFGH